MSHPWPMGPGRLQSPSDSETASLSARTSLLSPPYGEDDDGLPDFSRRVPRGPGSKFRHERERAHSSASSRDLLQLLVNEEYESKQMRKLLYTAFDRLEHETKRAEAAEVARDETIQRARSINEARATAQQQAVRAQEELKLYKLQLDNAQKEILRAQDVLKAIEAQRDEAEAAALSARSRARRLNEERLIDMAREEGRRLGFEEGVRRGRRMGHREATYAAGVEDRHEELREVATAVVDRLLESREEPEQIEVLQEPTPIPPPSSTRSAPEVYRVGTPVNSSLEHQPFSRNDSTETVGRSPSRRAHEPEVLAPPSPVAPRIISPTVSSQTPRPPSVSPSWTAPPIEPPFGRPMSAQNSPRRSEIQIPPDGYIPTADSYHNISLPPPHELHQIPSPTPSQRTLGPERRQSRDSIYDNHPPPRRGSPDDSLASGPQSAASTISQLDIVGLPSGSRHRDRFEGLSVIHEDVSMRSEGMTDRSQTIASASQTGRNSFREMPSSDTLRQQRDSGRRQLANELRYSDPSEAEQWRRQYESSRSQQPREGPPRHRPSHITVPRPLSPSREPQQPDARLRRSTSERQGRSQTRGEYRDERRPRSSDSSVPEINVESPSNPPSDAPSRGYGNVPPTRGFLSPEHANRPLPPPAPVPSTSAGRSSPVIPVVLVPGSPRSSQAHLAGEIQDVLPNGQLPPGFLPSPWEGSKPLSSGSGGSSAPPPQRYAVPPRTSSERERESERERGSGRSKSPIPFYAASPVPTGVTYPAPPISRSATYSAGHAYTQSNPSITSEGGGGRRRRDSMSATAGMTPASRTRPIATAGSTESGGSVRGTRVPRRQSTTSLASQPSQTRAAYSRYDPTLYNDPAYLTSNDSLADGRAGGETARPVRVREREPGGSSPGYLYAGLRP